MEEQVTGRKQDGTILNEIYEDMAVYDAGDNRIGRVEEVYLGSESEEGAQAELHRDATAAEAAERDSWVGLIADVFDTDRVPEVLARRLLLSGFIKIDSSGLFDHDRFATPDQIASVRDERVYLNVNRDDLVQETDRPE